MSAVEILNTQATKRKMRDREDAHWAKRVATNVEFEFADEQITTEIIADTEAMCGGLLPAKKAMRLQE